MNARNAHKNRQLCEMLYLLGRRGEAGATSLELAKCSGSLAPATCISELRQNGRIIKCKRIQRGDGTRIYRYRLCR